MFRNRPKCNQTDNSKVSDRPCHCEQQDEFLGDKVPNTDSGIVFEQFCVIRYVPIIMMFKISAKVPGQLLTAICLPKNLDY